MKAILLTSSALLLISGLSAAQAQDDDCAAEIDAFTRDYNEAIASFGGGEALSASEQADLFGLRTTAETAHRAGKPELCMDAISRAGLMLETAIAPTAIDPRELQGMEVRNAADEYLGEVDGMTLDPASGRIAYVLVEHGGFLGIGDNLTPVPWRAVTWTPGADALLLDIDEERLENAPRDLEGEATAQERRAWLLSVHSYYGVEPYWQSGFGSMVGAADSEQLEAQTVTTTMTSGDAAEPAAEQGGEAASVVVVGPETSGNGAAETQPSNGGGATVVAAAPGDGGGIDAVMSRIDELESRIEELSQQNVGEEVRQAIGDLEQRVQQLAESNPGQQVQSAIVGLEQRVQELAQSAPGEELRTAIAQLQGQVQELAQSAPGREVRDAVSRIEAEIRRLAGSGAATGTVGSIGDDGGAAQRAMTGRSGEAAEAEPGVAATDAAIGADGSRGSEQARVAEPGSEASDGSGAATQARAVEQSDGAPRVIVVRPEDVRVIEAGEAVPGDAAAAGRQDGSAMTGETPGAGDGSAMQAGANVATGAGRTEESREGTAALGAGQGETAMPQSESAIPSPEAGNENQAALDGQPGGIQPCETGISQLEEDLQRAQEMGLTIDEARSELATAQAMLSRDSQALCRAAVKRAQDQLVAQGLEPAQGN